jgi:hypothetical protein
MSLVTWSTKRMKAQVSLLDQFLTCSIEAHMTDFKYDDENLVEEADEVMSIDEIEGDPDLFLTFIMQHLPGPRRSGHPFAIARRCRCRRN